MDWDVLRISFPVLLRNTVTTLSMFAYALLLATLIGVIFALLRLSSSRMLRRFSALFVWFFRGTPTLVIMFFAFFWLGRNLGLSPFQSAVLALGVDAAAYKAEIFRAGILGVDPGQYEASQSLGMTKRHYMRRIVIPQSIRVIVPPYLSNTILLLQATSVASVIGVTELTGISRQLANSTFKPIEILTGAAIIYLSLASALVGLQEGLERRFRLKT